MRIILGCLIEICIRFIRKRTIYLIRGYMKEFLSFFERAIRQFPRRLRAVQHNGCSQHIGLHKHFRVLDTSVHMALGCKMNHTINIIFRKYFADGFFITDISADECVVGLVLNILQVLQIAGICEHIYVNDADFIAVLLKHVVNVVGADESCSACYQISSHKLRPPFGLKKL